MSVPLLSCAGLGVTRARGIPVFEDVSLTMGGGELVGLVGRNGAGKTTFLRALLGLVGPRTGVVRLEGRNLVELSPSVIARKVAYVPQTHAAVFPYTVRRMVELGRVPHRGLGHALGAADLDIVAHALDRLGLAALADRPVTTLSGGERQRVVLARAVAQEARVLLLDEPMTGLDLGHQMRLLALLREFAKEGRLVVLTSHQPDVLFEAASRVLVMDGGRIVADGAPANVLTAERVSRLYGVALKQVDHAGRRFFTPGA